MNDYKELIVHCEEWLEITKRLECESLSKHIEECADAIEQLIKERDAAVADLTVFYKCKICKHYNEKSANYGYTEFCENCGAYPWADDEEPNKWEWRGVQEDNT